jgi:hypothetical protein
MNWRNESVGIDETPTFRHLDEQMRGFELILRANRMLRRIGLGSRALAELQQQMDDIRAQMRELADYPERFNQHFSKDGWLAHGRLDFSVMKRAVDVYETNGPEAATGVLLQYFGPDSIGDRLFFLNSVEELRVRRRLIDLAFADYQAGRYYAVVPLLLMFIDGAVNDAVGKGFHAQTLDLWDSITTADGAINDIKSIFQQSRRKTRTEPIQLPYRNGILHGMDLAYDNEIVAAKCWCFVFVVADWIADKKSEAQRRERFAEETRVPSLRELAAQLAENERMKQATEEWSAREIRPEQLEAINRDWSADPGTPEEIVLRFLDLWTVRNYGGMAKLYWAADHPQSGRHAGDVRMMLGEMSVDSCLVDQIDDKAAAITQVRVIVNPASEHPCHYMFRLICETASGEVLPRGLGGGAWRVVWVQQCEQP